MRTERLFLALVWSEVLASSFPNKEEEKEIRSVVERHKNTGRLLNQPVRELTDSGGKAQGAWIKN